MSNLCIRWERIANEILMMFRTGKKFSREVSIYDPIGADKDGETVSLLDILEAGDREVLETVIIKQDVKILYEAYKENLTDMEQTVIRMRYGLFGTKEHTQREIAEKLGISRSCRSESIVSSTPTTSISMRSLPSWSVSMESESETSPCSFLRERKYIRISFAILS